MPVGHVGVGGGIVPLGIHILWPICKLFGFTPGFAAIIASTVVLYLIANR